MTNVIDFCAARKEKLFKDYDPHADVIQQIVAILERSTIFDALDVLEHVKTLPRPIGFDGER